MSVAQAHIWHLPRLLGILWAGTRGQGPVARRRDEDARAMAKVILQGKVQLWRSEGRARAFLVRDGVRIHALYTSPDWRGQGAALLLWAVRRTRSGGLSYMRPSTTAAHGSFICAMGFARCRAVMARAMTRGYLIF